MRDGRGSRRRNRRPRRRTPRNRLHRHAVPRERVRVSFGAAVAHAGGRTANVRNALAPCAMRCSVASSPTFTSSTPTKFERESGKAAVDENQRHARLGDAAQAVGILAARGDDKTVEMVGEHVLDLVLLQLRIALGTGNEEEVPFSRSLLESPLAISPKKG